MQISAYALIFFGLLAVIPALIVAVICILRIESQKIAIVTVEHEMKQVKADFDKLHTTVVNIGAAQESDVKKISDLDAAVQNVRCKSINIEESIASVSNKLNSRERVDRRNERREEEARRRDDEDISAIPGTEQQALPLFNAPASSNVLKIPKRKFGTMP